MPAAHIAETEIPASNLETRCTLPQTLKPATPSTHQHRSYKKETHYAAYPMDHDLERPRIKRQNKHKLRSLLSIHNIDAETFLNPSHQYTIPNYNTYRTDRLTNKGGGAAIPTKNNKTQSTRHSHQKYGNHSCTTLHLERTHQPARSVQSPQDAVFQTRQATIPYKNLTSTYRLETINDLSSDHLPVVLALHLDGFNT